MIGGMLVEQVTTATQIIAGEPAEARRTHMEATHGIQTTADNLVATQDADIIVLSVKPQIFSIVAKQIGGHIPPNALVISIMAGVTLSMLEDELAHKRVVRTMPNTPAQVNMGMTVWIASAEVSDEQRGQAQTMLRALGEEIEVQKEIFLDMHTGLGGSGPGFAFLMIEAMIDAGVQMGFSRGDSQQIVLQTMAGSIELVKQSGEHPAELRNRVTSPGGTTAAGIYALEKGGLRTILTDAVLAAYQRSIELGS